VNGDPVGLTGATRLAGVIGDPVRHSLSPILHNAAFRACGLDWAYLAFEVAAGSGGAAVAAMRTLDLGGLSVTMPHKGDVAAAVDRLSPVARRLGAVNCVHWEGDDLVGENTDGAGFLRSLAEDAGFEPKGRRCLVVGAGGAARAVVLALRDAGAQDIVVVNRSAQRAGEAAALAGPVGRVAGPDAAGAAIGQADLIVNATPIGMEGHTSQGNRLPLDPGLIRPGRIVADLVYHPLRTLLLEAADSRGAVTVSGVGMLLHQAGLAFEHWTGQAAPITAMREAMLGHVSARDDPEQGEREP